MAVKKTKKTKRNYNCKRCAFKAQSPTKLALHYAKHNSHRPGYKKPAAAATKSAAKKKQVEFAKLAARLGADAVIGAAGDVIPLKGGRASTAWNYCPHCGNSLGGMVR